MADKQFEIKIGVNSSGVQSGINDSIHQFERLKGFITGLPIVAAGGELIRFLREITGAATDLNESAEAAETTARAMQALRFAAEALKIPMEDVRTAIDKVKKAQSEAVTGSEEQVANFKRINFSLRDLRSMGGEEIFLRISAAVARGEIGLNNFAAVIAILGKDARKILPNLKNDLQGLADEFKNSGQEIPQGLVDALNQADREISTIWARIKAQTRKDSADIGGTIKNIWDAISGGANILKGGSWGGTVSGDEGMSEKGIGKWAGIALGKDAGNDEALTNAARLEGEMRRREAIKALEQFELETLKKKNDENEREVKLSGMTESQRHAELETEKASLEVQMRAAKTELEREQLRAKILGIDKKEKNHDEDRNPNPFARPQADSLLAIGGIRGGGEIANIPSQQLAVLRSIDKQISKISPDANKPSPEVKQVLSGIGSLINALTPYDEL